MWQEIVKMQQKSSPPTPPFLRGGNAAASLLTAKNYQLKNKHQANWYPPLGKGRRKRG
jgi:hypothetical protein